MQAPELCTIEESEHGFTGRDLLLTIEYAPGRFSCCFDSNESAALALQLLGAVDTIAERDAVAELCRHLPDAVTATEKE